MTLMTTTLMTRIVSYEVCEGQRERETQANDSISNPAQPRQFSSLKSKFFSRVSRFFRALRHEVRRGEKTSEIPGNGARRT
jgi:hypothetical protein